GLHLERGKYMAKTKKISLTPKEKEKNKKRFISRLKKYIPFYILFLPIIIMVVLYYYIPMTGIRFAFTEYSPFRGPTYIGLDNFTRLWATPRFWTAFKNTIQISMTNLFLGTFLSVIVALMLNEIYNLKMKKFFQTIVYVPHFLSWVVVASIFMIVLSPQTGFLNGVLINFGIIDEPIYFLAEDTWWRPVYYFIGRWKETGWGTIIYLATLAGISPELYEAANIDGATRWQQVKMITIPLLMKTIVIVLILNLQKVLNLFESVLVLYNDLVLDVADVIQTYIDRISIIATTPDYGFSTAVGLFKSLISLVLVLGSNWASKKVRGRGII
ncbi:MAG: ABC transporter permease, partial [Lachnospirales bacterium]